MENDLWDDTDPDELHSIIEDEPGDWEVISEEEYDLLQYLSDEGIIFEYGSDEIKIIDCPGCENPIYYDGSEFATCPCCGYVNLAEHSEDAYTLSEYEERDE